ncbi:hypothetical protein JCM17207_21920 [Faecalibacterium gallinarum]|uniref:FAD-dependent oxidoreductase 2 FAD-binding domain-containing protein n=1 Tax=Faecalibacterium gallinarum TaxID=2903556 RepID=A0AA37MZU0_9FIRM|nr:hypothetical protein JCM17207_21920 [Faecalibacterium gallinarum]
MDWFVKKLTESGMVEGQDFNIFSEGEYHYEGGGEAYGKLCMCTGSYTAAINSLGEYFKEKFTIYFKTPAVQLIKENDKVVGVYAKKEDGTILKVTANKGVVLATGDYQNNDAMVQKYLPDAAIFDKKQFGRTGDGHLMGLMAGAKMQNIGHTKMIHTKNWGGCCTLMKSLPFMAVNKNGVRFTSEDIPYDLRNNFVKNQPGLCWLSIFDANYQEQYAAMGYSGRDISTPDQIAESDGAFVADTLEDLAEQMGIDAAALVATVERYNEMCEQGFDLEFGKPAKYMAPSSRPPSMVCTMSTRCLPLLPAWKWIRTPAFWTRTASPSRDSMPWATAPDPSMARWIILWIFPACPFPGPLPWVMWWARPWPSSNSPVNRRYSVCRSDIRLLL